MQKISKKAWIAIAAAVLVLAAVVITVVVYMTGKNDSYRSILVYEIMGKASIEREGTGKMEAYENLQLQSGDTVTVGTDSGLRLKLDDDKYIMVEQESELTIVADGDSEDSKTSIDLKKGAITNEIQNELSEDSSYEVTTPNSVMAVRGTVFRVAVEYDEDGNSYTRVSTFDGTVASRLIKPDGTIVDEEVTVEAGKEVIIEGTTDDSQYLAEPEDIDFTTLPTQALEALQEIIENGTPLCITEEELQELIQTEEEEPEFYTITFQYKGNIFGTQQVEPGEKVAKPKLSPAADGQWDYDFSKEVHEDVIIQWK